MVTLIWTLDLVDKRRRRPWLAGKEVLSGGEYEAVSKSTVKYLGVFKGHLGYAEKTTKASSCLARMMPYIGVPKCSNDSMMIHWTRALRNVSSESMGNWIANRHNSPRKHSGFREYLSWFGLDESTYCSECVVKPDYVPLFEFYEGEKKAEQRFRRSHKTLQSCRGDTIPSDFFTETPAAQ